MYCCGSCFGSSYLTEHISLKPSQQGNCNFCPAQAVDLIEPVALYDFFSSLFDLYEKVETGQESLIKLLRDDWNLFSGVDDEVAKSILRELLEDDEFDFDGYQYIRKDQEEDAVKWDEFKEELKHDNRYFPESFPDHEELSTLLASLSVQTDTDLKQLYRARKNADRSTRHPIEKMGSPPSELATAGRANPFGIAYLYVASTEKTALSELRPHKGETFTVAEFSLVGSLKLVDLRNPRDTVSPFRYSDEELKTIHARLGLLVTLGEELTKPVSQEKAHLEYLSSQYLCEFIKSEGYEGVIYKSSLGDGDNYAIFDTSKLKAVKTRVFEVTDVDVNSNEVGEEEVVEDEAPVGLEASQGSVKWFNAQKGFGFITDSNGRGDIFVHYTAINDEGWKNLKPDQVVNYEIENAEKGLQAHNVNFVSEH